MSRSTVAKSRQDKTSKGVASAPTPAVTHEIVPGKFTDQDWNSMLDRDDGEEFIHGIVEEVCSSAMDTIFQNYIHSQLIPYTVTQAKDALLQIIEWQFLSRDEGEGVLENDAGWAEDEEPEPAVTDCWAQGSVPRSILTSRENTIMEEEPQQELQHIAEEQEEDHAEVEVDLPPPLETEPTVIVEEKTTLAIEETIREEKQESRESTKPQERKKKRRGYKPHTGPVRPQHDKALTESLDKTEMKMLEEEYRQYETEAMAASPDTMMQQMPTSCQSILKVKTPSLPKLKRVPKPASSQSSKLQAGRPPGNRDVVYDAHGNVVSVNKLDPEKLPTHSVRTRFTIVDPSDEPKRPGVNIKFQAIDPNTEASLRRVEAMRKGKALKPQPPSTPSPRRFSVKTAASMAQPVPAYSGTKDGQPLPPPLRLIEAAGLESMAVATGVVVREGDRVKRGPKHRAKQTELMNAATKRGLHAIHIKCSDPTLTVAEILNNQQPVIKAIESSPIPPINSHSGSVC